MRDFTRRDFIKTGSLVVAAGMSGCSFSSRELDILIKNGTVYDGTGRAGMNVSVGIIGDRIVEVGNLSDAPAAVVIDAQGLAVAPGFINIHTHTDSELLRNPEGMSSVMQGITTEITGQCGGSMGPYLGSVLEESAKRNADQFGFEKGFANVGDFLDLLEKNGTGINLATMVGHGTVRGAVIGQSGREPTPDELQKMSRLIDEAMQQGAVGFSTGLEYTPGSFAKLEELTELAKVLKPYGLPYASHMRNEDNYLLEAIDEAITVSREAGCPLQISHLKVQGKPNWINIDKVFTKIESAAEATGTVTFDRYPYVAYSTGLSNLFPIHVREGGTDKYMQRLDDPALASEIRTYVENKVNDLGSWHSVMISRIRDNAYAKYIGMRLDEIARDLGKSDYETALELIKRNRGSVGMVGFGMSEDNTDRILAHPLGMICSDGSALPADTGGSPHPRSFGSFARVLGYYVRERKIMDLPTAVKKMSLMPAEKLKLTGRGKIANNCFADIVIFDPEKVIDMATFEEPKQYAAGIRHVLVNGKLAVKDGGHTGVLAGKALRSG